VDDPLSAFAPPVREWFRTRYGEPTPPQVLGWPAIRRGEHTLILSPTGSGKTMAAFLWGIHRVFSDLAEQPDLSGVQILYISPLKALNNDIERNLREPLAGIRRTAREMGTPLPALHTAVRTGDTPASVRQSMVRRPPHILITTPESLYLLLGSPRARDMLRSIHTVILDEIHTLCGNKRGVHLGLSLERLLHLTDAPFQRIGLSATQRPLDEVARFLVGQEWEPDPESGERLVSREVTVVDAGTEKKLDLKVVTTVPDLRRLPGGSIWPSLIPNVLDEVRRHRTTLIFTNSRRGAERASDRLNEQYALEEDEEVPPGSPTALLSDGVPKAQGMFGTGRIGGPFRAHHGSVSREVRLELEEKLKAGELPALIATSSLELGIDIGQVDKVIHLQSPRSIARGLQRIGRSGHLVGQTSVGRIYVTHREDLLDAAAVAHGMLHGDIEPTYTPHNCLDVLAQQIVAIVSMEDWEIEPLYRLVRQAYGYQNLSRDALTAVIKMLGGGYPAEVFRELRPRIAWDRVHNRLSALPGSRLLALRNGGTITDRGQFRVVLADGETSLGTLDEEFVYETRAGDVFTLGTNTWRVLEIDDDRMVVTDATGSMPRMPFWRGDAPRRDYHMGLRLGAFRRELAERVADLPPLPDDPSDPFPEEARAVIDWLISDYAMDGASARNAILYVRQQLDVAGTISSDRTVVVETFNDAMGDLRMVVHSCFGSRINSAWALALTHALQEQLHWQVETQVNDDGILFHFLRADREPPVDLVQIMGPDEARERLLLELPNSALFGAQFRMNASRALLLPGITGGNKRTPFWVQRMRARELLATTRGFDDFPILTETYRDCLRDVLDLEHLMGVLAAIQRGDIRVHTVETVVPSPVAAGLLFDFIAIQMYEDDTPRAERQMQALSLNRELLGDLLDQELLPDLLRPEAISGVEEEIRHLAEGYRARSAEELAVILHDLGDLTTDEIVERCMGEGRAWLLQLAAQGRALEVEVPTAQGAQRRWISAEDYWRYRDGFGLPEQPPIAIPHDLLEPHRTPETARETLLRVLTRTHGPLIREQMLARYAFPEDWLDQTLQEMVDTGHLVAGYLTPGASEKQWCDRRVLERIHRRTLSLLRREVQPVELPAYANFLLRWQGVHPAHRRYGEEALPEVLQSLRGLSIPAVVWERDLLPTRIGDYSPARLDELTSRGDLVWIARGEDPARARAGLFFRGEGGLFMDPETGVVDPARLGEATRAVYEFIYQEGACYADDIRRTLGLSATDLDASLVELLLAGVITGDRYEMMRRVLAGNWARPQTSRGIRSSLDEDLRAWRANRPAPPISRPSATRLRQARRDAERRISPPTPWNGRWWPVRRVSIWGVERSEDERAEIQARQLLQRYGVVTRECLDNEEGPWSWGALYRQYQMMEFRGEVRRGYFVRGLPGVQFALPEAVERLRTWSRSPAEGEQIDDLTLVNACDPAVIYGPALEGAASSLTAGLPDERNPYRFSRLPSNYLVIHHGVPILLYEHGGSRWSTLPQADDDQITRAMRLCLEHFTREGGICSQPRRVLVRTWNGEPPLNSDGRALLEALGFRREPPAMVWDGL
jgi:ATP-dependent Lhr-like helicase